MLWRYKVTHIHTRSHNTSEVLQNPTCFCKREKCLKFPSWCVLRTSDSTSSHSPFGLTWLSTPSLHQTFKQHNSLPLQPTHPGHLTATKKASVTHLHHAWNQGQPPDTNTTKYKRLWTLTLGKIMTKCKLDAEEYLLCCSTEIERSPYRVYIQSFSSKTIWLSPCHCPDRTSGVCISTGIQIQNICHSCDTMQAIFLRWWHRDTEKVRKLISDKH